MTRFLQLIPDLQLNPISGSLAAGLLPQREVERRWAEPASQGYVLVAGCCRTVLMRFWGGSVLPTVLELSLSSPRRANHVFVLLPLQSATFSLLFAAVHHLPLPPPSPSLSSLLFTQTVFRLLLSPVLTPPESEKADSEDRVSLKVCDQLLSAPPSPCQADLLTTSDLCLSAAPCLFVRLQREQSFTPSTPTWLSTSSCLRRRTTWSCGQSSSSLCFDLLSVCWS